MKFISVPGTLEVLFINLEYHSLLLRITVYNLMLFLCSSEKLLFVFSCHEMDFSVSLV